MTQLPVFMLVANAIEEYIFFFFNWKRSLYKCKLRAANLKMASDIN